ncbi:MAG: hypothetical protein J6Y99_00830, partial [Bacteroidales bacterium]|nr:hypothetical protein [Bacteroidales bacterium]
LWDFLKRAQTSPAERPYDLITSKPYNLELVTVMTMCGTAHILSSRSFSYIAIMLQFCCYLFFFFLLLCGYLPILVIVRLVFDWCSIGVRSEYDSTVRQSMPDPYRINGGIGADVRKEKGSCSDGESVRGKFIKG